MQFLHNVVAVAVYPVTCDVKLLRVQPVEAARLGGNARITCNFQGTDLDIQYITWTKEFIGGGDVFVYGYDACANENRGYSILRDRALLDIAKPTGLKHVRRELGADSNRTMSYDRSSAMLANEGDVEVTNMADMQAGAAILTIQVH